jgi:GDP-L-fucose synthase
MTSQNTKIYVAGHNGMVGSAIVRKLQTEGYDNTVLRTSTELNLQNQASVDWFFAEEKPEYVFMAAANVGGIYANNTYPADFIRDNLQIQTNVIDAAYRNGVKSLLFLGSSCIYPKLAPQPMTEECLLTGPLEPTNRPYALAKIAGIEMCWSYNRQYGTQYLAVMPTNLYGPNDNYDLDSSHVLPALIRKMHEAKLRGDSVVVVWGTGTPKREFLCSDDMADACIYLMEQKEDDLASVFNNEQPPLLNIGCGEDLSICELAELVAEVVGFKGKLTFDTSKPDGTMRKLMDVARINALGWQHKTPLNEGIALSYQDMLSKLSLTEKAESGEVSH